MSEAIRLLGSTLHNMTAGQVTLTPQTVIKTAPLTVSGELGQPVEVRRTTDWTPGPGSQILCLRVGTSVWAIGPVTPVMRPPSIGTVVSVAGSMVTVALGSTFGNVPMPSTVTVTAGQRVGVSWMQDNTGAWVGFIAGTIQANPAPAPPPPPPPPGSTSGSTPSGAKRTFSVRAVEAKTWRGGWRGDTTDAYQGIAGAWGSRTTNRGYLFYGAGAFDDMRGLTVTAASIRLTAKRGVGISGPSPIRIRLHTSTTRPNSQPVLLADEVVVSLRDGETRTVPLPVSMAQKLASGTAGGIAFVSDSTADYGAIVGPTGNASSGLITIIAN